MKADQAGVQLELNCLDDIDFVMNGPLIEQAIINLIVNAIAYSKPSGTVTVQCSVVESEPGQVITISVIDSGIGIKKEHLPRLFETILPQ